MSSRFNFRFYDEKNKKMIGYYNLLENKQMINFVVRQHELDKGWYMIMQSTGLEDKNGKEIFENDIVKGEYEGKQLIFEVIWKKTGFCLRSTIMTMSFANVNNIEVIGNIYEKPNLLMNEEENNYE